MRAAAPTPPSAAMAWEELVVDLELAEGLLAME